MTVVRVGGREKDNNQKPHPKNNLHHTGSYCTINLHLTPVLFKKRAIVSRTILPIWVFSKRLNFLLLCLEFSKRKTFKV